jgi:CysZ protein
MLKEIIISIQSYFEAHRFIVKHRLWKWIFIPGLIYSILFIAGMYFFWKSSNTAIEWVMFKSGVKGWLDRMHDNWLYLLFFIARIIIYCVLLVFYFSLFKFLFLIIGSPVFAYLSEKTESILMNRDFPFSTWQLFKDIGRAVRLALRNMLWQSVYMLSILILSLIPVAGWITPLLALFVDCYYLGFSMLDYSSERNKLSVGESIALIGHHRGLAIGNGMVFYMMHAIPIIGWLFAPSYAVIAATLSLHRARKHHVIID